LPKQLYRLIVVVSHDQHICWSKAPRA
jgi:hypothetical protein